MISIARFLALFACFFVFGTSQASALCADLPDPENCYLDLVHAVENTFPLLDATLPTTPTPATAGTNWCFEAETDTTTNWWYFKNSGNYAHSADGGVRIKVTYKLPSSGAIGFASIFLAVDLLKRSDYALLDKDKMLTTPIGVGQGSSVTIPEPSNNQTTACPRVVDFIKAAFPKYLGTWVLIADPLCGSANNPCGQSTINGKNVDNVQISDTNMTEPLYWRFNETTHTIAGAMRFVIQFTSGPYKDQFGVLWVGYGGSGAGG
jgi:hypothetical protein